MASVTDPVVLLLHDQMQDARVWSGFADLLATHAHVVTVRAEPPSRFFARPSEWARYMGGEVRKLLTAGAPAALTVALGRSALAALSLVEDELSHQALLINPDLPSASFNASEIPTLDTISPEDRERFAAAREGALAERDGPYSDQINEGIIREEGASYLMTVASESQNLDALGDVERRLVEQIQTEQFSRLLPLSLGAIAGDLIDETGWLAVAARHPERCTVALSGSLLNSTIYELVSQETPSLPIVNLPLVTPYPWLEDPQRIDALVGELLDQR